jgi:uncharacterized SAM-dependent methyltransferase
MVGYDAKSGEIYLNKINEQRIKNNKVQMLTNVQKSTDILNEYSLKHLLYLV